MRWKRQRRKEGKRGRVFIVVIGQTPCELKQKKGMTEIYAKICIIQIEIN